MITTRNRPPLGLPNGSVRALLTLLVVAVVIVEVIRRHEVEPLWTETLMIVLAHYFSSRRFITLSPELVRRLEGEGKIEVESNPLYLPRHSIRAIIVLAFVGLAIYLYREHELVRFFHLVDSRRGVRLFAGRRGPWHFAVVAWGAADGGGPGLGGFQSRGRPAGVALHGGSVLARSARSRAAPNAKHGAGPGAVLFWIEVRGARK